MSGFAEADLSRDALLGGRISLLQPRTGYRATIDPVLLAAFVPVSARARVLDLGCGAGSAALCLGARVPGLELHGLELAPAYAALARRNAADNGIALTVHEGDVAQPPTAVRALSFDAVMMNPPFFATADPPARDAGRAAGRREGAAPLAVWIATALRRLRSGGALVLIHRTERLAAILGALAGPAGAIEILPLASRAGRSAERVLVRARKGSRAPLVLRAPLTIHAGDAHGGDRASYTDAVEAVLRYGAELQVVTR